MTRFETTEAKWRALYTDGGKDVTVNSHWTFRVQYAGASAARHESFLLTVPVSIRPPHNVASAWIRFVRDVNSSAVAGEPNGARIEIRFVHDGPWVAMPLPSTANCRALYRAWLIRMPAADDSSSSDDE